MGPLGIVLAWGGYLFGIWGLSKLKSARAPDRALSLSDLALPSHRGTYIAAVKKWAAPIPGNQPTTGTSTGPGGTNVVTPQAPKGVSVPGAGGGNLLNPAPENYFGP